MDSVPEGHHEAMFNLLESMKEDGFDVWLDKAKLQKENEKTFGKSNTSMTLGSNLYVPLRWEIFDPPKKFRQECKNIGYKFTVGNKYPIFCEIFYETQDIHTDIFYLTEDDNGARRSLNCMYFNEEVDVGVEEVDEEVDVEVDVH